MGQCPYFFGLKKQFSQVILGLSFYITASAVTYNRNIEYLENGLINILTILAKVSN